MLVETRLIVLTPDYLTTNQSGECAPADVALLVKHFKTGHYPLQDRTHSLDRSSPLWPPLPGNAVKLFLSTSPKTLCLCVSVQHQWTEAEFQQFTVSLEIFYFTSVMLFFILIKQLSSYITCSLRCDSETSTNCLFFVCNFKNKRFVLTIGLSNLLVGLLSFLSHLFTWGKHFTTSLQHTQIANSLL